MYLYDADGTTQIADCGKITRVNTENGADVTSQTYTLPCDSSQLASYVTLKDSETTDEDNLVMNIAEVTVYGTDRSLKISKSQDTNHVFVFVSVYIDKTTNRTLNC